MDKLKYYNVNNKWFSVLDIIDSSGYTKENFVKWYNTMIEHNKDKYEAIYVLDVFMDVIADKYPSDGIPTDEGELLQFINMFKGVDGELALRYVYMDYEQGKKRWFSTKDIPITLRMKYNEAVKKIQDEGKYIVFSKYLSDGRAKDLNLDDEVTDEKLKILFSPNSDELKLFQHEGKLYDILGIITKKDARTFTDEIDDIRFLFFDKYILTYEDDITKDNKLLEMAKNFKNGSLYSDKIEDIEYFLTLNAKKNEDEKSYGPYDVKVYRGLDLRTEEADVWTFYDVISYTHLSNNTASSYTNSVITSGNTVSGTTIVATSELNDEENQLV